MFLYKQSIFRRAEFSGLECVRVQKKPARGGLESGMNSRLRTKDGKCVGAVQRFYSAPTRRPLVIYRVLSAAPWPRLSGFVFLVTSCEWCPARRLFVPRTQFASNPGDCEPAEQALQRPILHFALAYPQFTILILVERGDLMDFY